MNKFRNTGLIFLFFLSIASIAQQKAGKDGSESDKELKNNNMQDDVGSRAMAKEYIITLRPTKVTYKDLVPENPALKLIEGKLLVDETEYQVYLPAKGPYKLKNTSPDKLDILLFSNATRICVDYNRDGKIGGDESWAADYPIRFGNKMLSVKSISKDGGTLILRDSDAPLSGFVIGQQVPNFELKDQNGKVHMLRVKTSLMGYC